MRPMTVRSNDGLIHGVFLGGASSLEVMSICGVFYARETIVPSQAVTCLRCARNKRGHRMEPEA